MKLKHYLVASEHNDWRPWIIRPTAFACLCLLTWGLRFAVPAEFSFAQGSIDADDVMAKINLERTNRFISALTTNSRLNAAAAAKSNDMIDRSYFAHVDPSGNYVWPRIEAAGYRPYITLGENLAIDFTTSSAVVEAWMNSPTHRANIVNQKFEDQGLAAVYGLFEPNHYSILVTSLFGTLLKSNSTPQPSPQPQPPPSPNPVPPPAKTTPKPKPAAPPPPASNVPQTPQPKIAITINPDIHINKKVIGNDQILEVDVVIAGAPSKVTGTIKDKSIILLPSATSGQYLGVFTFPAAVDLNEERLSIEAIGTSKEPAHAEFPLKNIYDRYLPESNPVGSIPVSSEAQFIRVLKIIFAILAAIYMIFLALDSIIIHRARIKRTGIHSSWLAILFLLITVANILSI